MNIAEIQLEFFLLVLARVSAFIYTAPFFSIKNTPRRVKTGLSAALALVLFFTLPTQNIEYDGVLEYGILVAGEALAGAIMGYIANLCYHVLAFVGQIIDMEIGFSMVNEFDPVSSTQVTITGNLYSYAIMLVLFVTYMHHYILQALVDSYILVPVGAVSISPGIYSLITTFMTDYFVLGFRIVLPIFAAILVVNCVLAILAKVAPQMNMFVIGLQLKVLVGLVIIFLMMEMIPSVADNIFSKMIGMLRDAIGFLG